MNPTTPKTLEDILLSHDRRQMTALRPYLPANFCRRAGNLAYTHGARVIITTGFFLTHLQAPETDGPPGALAVGRALEALGGRVTYVTDCHTANLMRQLAADPAQVAEFPVTGAAESRQFAGDLLERWQPTLLVSVERCGITAAGSYLNVRGKDISALTARVDELFGFGIPSLAVGDGGNEIGMGNLAEVIAATPGLPSQPVVTRVDELVIASVSNWGAYGVAAALSVLAGRDLLPEREKERELICRLFELGCYDGMCDTPVCGVDGFTLEENDGILADLGEWVGRQK